MRMGMDVCQKGRFELQGLFYWEKKKQLKAIIKLYHLIKTVIRSLPRSGPGYMSFIEEVNLMFLRGIMFNGGF